VHGGIKLAFIAAVFYSFFWILVQTAVVYISGNHDLVTKSQVMLGMLISSMFVLFPALLLVTLVFWYASKKLENNSEKQGVRSRKSTFRK
jgi:DNA repair exonuclease SbcCD nuclease subunit